MGCLLDHPLLTPRNAYDPKVALRRDSLARFDSVEILLMDPADPSVSIRLWKGPLASTDGLPPHLAGDGQTLVYVVNGYRAGRGRCFTEHVSQEGLASVLLDSCAKKKDSTPDPDPVHGHVDPPVLKFQRDTLEFGKGDTATVLSIKGVAGSGDSSFELLAAPWIKLEHRTIHTNHDTDITVTITWGSLAVGANVGPVYLLENNGSGSTKTLDTALLLAIVPKPMSRIAGTLTEWGDSLPQKGFILKLDGAGPGILSNESGAFSFEGLVPGTHTLSFMAEGRIGGMDTFTVAGGDSSYRNIILPPAGTFKTIPLSWSHPLGQTAIAGGQGVLLSSDFDQPGSVMTFPLDNPSPSLQKFILQGNDNGLTDFPEYFEAGEVTGDSDALYLSFPDGSRLVRIGDWKNQPRRISVAIPFQPGGLYLDGPRLMAIGRLPDSTMILGDFNAADLSLNRMDTLTGFRWDGVLPDQRTPKLSAFGNSYFAVDGNSANAKGHVLRIGRDSRRVEGSKELADAMLNDLAIHDGMIYVTAMASPRKLIRIFDPSLSQTDSIVAGTSTNRIAFATEGPLRGYGFVTTDDNAVLVLHSPAKVPVGRLALPGILPARSLSVDGKWGKILVSDGEKLHMAEF